MSRGDPERMRVRAVQLRRSARLLLEAGDEYGARFILRAVARLEAEIVIIESRPGAVKTLTSVAGITAEASNDAETLLDEDDNIVVNANQSGRHVLYDDQALTISHGSPSKNNTVSREYFQSCVLEAVERLNKPLRSGDILDDLKQRNIMPSGAADPKSVVSTMLLKLRSLKLIQRSAYGIYASLAWKEDDIATDLCVQPVDSQPKCEVAF